MEPSIQGAAVHMGGRGKGGARVHRWPVVGRLGVRRLSGRGKSSRGPGKVLGEVQRRGMEVLVTRVSRGGVVSTELRERRRGDTLFCWESVYSSSGV